MLEMDRDVGRENPKTIMFVFTSVINKSKLESLER